MIFALIFQLLFVGLLIFGAFKLFSRTSRRGGSEFSIRRLFHYSLLFFSLVILGVGLTGLLGRLINFGEILAESRTDLARNLAFTIVGAPLVVVLARWSQRNQQQDPSESKSFAWHAYLTITSITSLSVSLFGLHGFLSWLIGDERYQGSYLAQLIIWSMIWFVHYRLSLRVSDAIRPQYLIGSGIGLAILAVGFGGLIGSVIEQLININQEITVLKRTNPMVNNVITILMGAPVWYIYWMRGALALTRDFLWHAYVFLVGIAASFIGTVVAASFVIYDLLVWFFGDTGDKTAIQHFFESANPIGAAVITFAIWAYHRSLMDEAEIRSELRRIYEYINSGISLIAASLGIVMIIVAAVESITPSDIATFSEGSNTLILAITLLIVGAPTWWFFWNRIQNEALSSKEGEGSPTRRIFLLMLFGVSAVAAVISLISGLFITFDDLLNNEFSSGTFRETRYALAILLTNGAIAGYHWSIYRSERDVAVTIFHKGRHITLVGPDDEHIVQLLKEQVGGNIQLWISPDSGSPWNLQELVNLVDETQGDEILIINENRNLRALPIHH